MDSIDDLIARARKNRRTLAQLRAHDDCWILNWARNRYDGPGLSGEEYERFASFLEEEARRERECPNCGCER